MKHRKTSLILASFLLAQILAGCGASGTAADTEMGGGTTSDNVTTVPEEPARDFGGKALRVHMHQDYMYQMYAEEENGDVTNDAIYRRNSALEDKYNFVIEPVYISSDINAANVWSKIAPTIMAGDDAFDLVGHYSYNYYKAMGSGQTLVNWREVPNIDFDQPWWVDSINDGTTLNGKLYGIAGYLSTTIMQMSYGFYFNDTLVQDYGLTAEKLYKTVEDGKWTIDYLGSIVKNMYKDLNGDGKRDIGDQYGFASMPDNSPDVYLAAFNQPITGFDDNGRLTAVHNTEKTASVIEKMIDLYYNNEGAVNLETLTTYKTNGANDYFANEQLVFVPSTFLAAFSTYRDMKSEYGILPPPKWDEKQQQYYTHIQDKFTAYAIPVTATDLDFIGFVTEKLCEATYRDVYPVFYDVALKDKYSKDENAAAMVDLIMEGVTFDAGWVFGSYIGGTQTIVRAAIKNNDPNMASKFASAVMKIDELYKMYE